MRIASTSLAAVVVSAAMGISGCAVEKKSEGDITLPAYEVSKTQEGNVTVPTYEVTTPDVTLQEKKVEVTVPDIDIKTANEKKAEGR